MTTIPPTVESIIPPHATRDETSERHVPVDPSSSSVVRFHALDSVRATAIILGVLYHAIQFGAFMPGRFNPADPSMRLLGWLHSFRMPLFFLISGFFCAMMLGKYGVRRYLAKRWLRIGLPLAVGLVTLVPLYLWTMSLGQRPGPMGAGGEGPSIRLDYLWFLWYLLAFVTASPALAGLGRLGRRIIPRMSDAVGRVALRFDLAPLVLGLVTGPVLLLAPSWFGWSLPVAMGVNLAFPEFLYRLQPDMLFYAAYFAAGWWLFGRRDGLGDVARTWLVSLVIGIAAHVGAEALSGSFAMRRDMPRYELIRLGGYVLYGIGAAFSAFGVIGLFLRFLDRPTRLGRYLADTALWIYLIHMPFLWPLLRALAPLNLPWWVQGPLVASLITGAALLLYELVVRPTPLVWIFGPARPRKREPKHVAGPTAREGHTREVSPSLSI